MGNERYIFRHFIANTRLVLVCVCEREDSFTFHCVKMIE